MVTNRQVRDMALALPGASEQDHWGKPSFRVGKKIFATLHSADRRAVLKFAIPDQQALVAMAPEIYSTGGWAHQGWTMIDLRKVRKTRFGEQLELAWRQVAPAKLIREYEAT